MTLTYNACKGQGQCWDDRSRLSVKAKVKCYEGYPCNIGKKKEMYMETDMQTEKNRYNSQTDSTSHIT